MRKLVDKTNAELLEKISWIHTSENENMADILLYLDEVRFRDLHLERGYKSLYKFLADEHGYPKNQAYLRMRAAEALEIEPAVEDAVRSGRVCATYLQQAVVAIRRENKRRRLDGDYVRLFERRDLIQKIIATGEAKRTIAEFFPNLQLEIEESKPLAGKKTLLQFAVTEEDLKLIERAKELLSNKVHDGNLHDVVMEMVSLTIKKLEPKKNATPDRTPTMKQREYRSVDMEGALYQQANHQCEYRSPDGHRCDERRDLQVDHIIPIAHGGTDSFNNLRIVCGAHNRYLARKAGLNWNQKIDFS